MRHLSFRATNILPALLGLSLAGCIGHQCYPSETGPPLAGFVFSTDTLGTGLGYHKAEAFTAYLVRYRGIDLSQPLDTLRPTDKKHSAFYYVDRTLFCNLPAIAGSTDPHSYRLEVPAAKRRYDLHDLVFHYGDVQDCTRTVARLDALLNGQRVDMRRGYTLTK